MAYVSQEMKAKLSPEIKRICKKYGIKASIAVRHHSTLVLNISQGKIDFGTTEQQVNTYWIEDHYKDKPRAMTFLLEVLDAMKGPDFFDHSDIQTDYFHRSHYVDINIGSWKKPYVKI